MKGASATVPTAESRAVAGDQQQRLLQVARGKFFSQLVRTHLGVGCNHDAVCSNLAKHSKCKQLKLWTLQ